MFAFCFTLVGFTIILDLLLSLLKDKKERKQFCRLKRYVTIKKKKNFAGGKWHKGSSVCFSHINKMDWRSCARVLNENLQSYAFLLAIDDLVSKPCVSLCWIILHKNHGCLRIYNSCYRRNRTNVTLSAFESEICYHGVNRQFSRENIG